MHVNVNLPAAETTYHDESLTGDAVLGYVHVHVHVHEHVHGPLGMASAGS